ncbi:hypothetical protein E2320_020935, partial [Naja naja]
IRFRFPSNQRRPRAVPWRLHELGRAHAQLFSELVAVGKEDWSGWSLIRPRPSCPHQSLSVPKATSSPVRDYVVWSLFSFTTCNCCCLGLFALFYSIKVNGAGKDMGRALSVSPPPALFFHTGLLLSLSLSPFLSSLQDRKVLGDPEGAANHGRTAKYLNIAAVTITIIVYIIFIIILISSALFIVNIIFEIMRLPDEIEELRRN